MQSERFIKSDQEVQKKETQRLQQRGMETNIIIQTCIKRHKTA